MVPGRCEWLPTAPVYGIYTLWVCDPVHVNVNRCQPGWVKSGRQISCVCMYAWQINLILILITPPTDFPFSLRLWNFQSAVSWLHWCLWKSLELLTLTETWIKHEHTGILAAINYTVFGSSCMLRLLGDTFSTFSTILLLPASKLASFLSKYQIIFQVNVMVTVHIKTSMAVIYHPSGSFVDELENCCCLPFQNMVDLLYSRMSADFLSLINSFDLKQVCNPQLTKLAKNSIWFLFETVPQTI